MLAGRMTNNRFLHGFLFLLGTVIVLMAMILIYQVIARYVLDAPSSYSQGILTYSFVWLGLLSAGYCFLTNLHLNLPLLQDKMPASAFWRVEIINAMLCLLFGGIMVVGGWQLIGESSSSTVVPVLKVPFGTIQSVVVIGGIFIVASQLLSLWRILLRSDTSAAAFILVVTSCLAFFCLVYGFGKTEYFEIAVFEHLQLTSTLVLFGSFFVMLGIGTPIAVALALSGVLTLGLQIDLDLLLSTVGERMFSSLDNYGFLALPFFILAGNIMNKGGIALRLIDFALELGKGLPGSLWQANVLANMMFGSLSGSGLAAASAIGTVIAPIAEEKQYDRRVTTAVNAASAPTGMLIPPSGPLIVYSLLTGGSASITGLFLAGYTPGLIMGVSVMIVAYFHAKSRNYPTSSYRGGMHRILNTFLKALPGLSLIIVVMGGIISGIFTAVEASGIAVLYSVILAMVYRSLSWRNFAISVGDTVVTVGVIVFLIACSGLMSWSMTFASIPDTIGNAITALTENRYAILVIISVALLVIGTFMDMTPAMLIFVPIFYPVVTDLGVDPIHFGIIVVYNLCVGVVTPPVGTILFVSCGITGENILHVIRPLLPMFILQFVGLLCIIFFPWLSLWLPSLLS